MGLGELLTRKFWSNVGKGVAVTLLAAAGISAFTFQVQHYARAGETYDQQRINEDAIARVSKLATELAEARKADNAAAAAEYEQTRRLCLSRKLNDRDLCASVGIELP